MTDFVYSGRFSGADDPRIEYLKKFSRASITWRGEYSHAYFIDTDEMNLLPVGISGFLFGDHSRSNWRDEMRDARVTAVFGDELEAFLVAMRSGTRILMPGNHPSLGLLASEPQIVTFDGVTDFYTKAQSLLDENPEKIAPGKRWKQIEQDESVWKRFVASFGHEAVGKFAWKKSESHGDDRITDPEVYRKIIREKGWQHKEDIYLNEFEWFTKKPCVSPQISIVIISYGYNPDVLVNLVKIGEQQGFQMIFVNNGGTIEEFEPVASLPHVYLKLKENKGAYLARNAGAVFATAPIILFLDDDALPAGNLIRTHIENFKRYDIVSLRGVCLPRTNNPYNGLPRHYYLGDEPFPRFANIEGNTSYRTDIFFRADGWSDDIRFGGGGLDLALKILRVDPDLQKHMYSSEPVIYHDYVHNSEHLEKKSQKQQKSRSRLFRKFPDHLDKVSQWNNMRHRTNLLHLHAGYSEDSGVMTEAKKSPQLYRLLQVRNWQYKFGYYDFYWSHVDKFNPPDETSISVVWVTDRLDDQLRDNIRQIKSQDDHVGTVLVNNGGNAEDFSDAGCDYVVHLKNRANNSTARNLGSLMVKSPVILFLGNHCVPSGDLVHRHLGTYLKYRVVTLEGEILMDGDAPPDDRRSYSIFPVEEDHISFMTAGFVMIKGFADHENEHGIHELNLRMMNIAADLAQNRHDPACVVYSKERRGLRQQDVLEAPPAHLRERPWQMEMYRNWMKLGEIRYRLIPHEEAIAMIEIMNSSGQLLAKGKFKEALPGFEKCIRMNSLNYQCSSMLSYVYLHLGEIEKAEKAIQPAVTMLPLNEDMVSNHIGILTQMGRIEEAKKYCEDFLRQKTHVNIQKILIQIEQYLEQNPPANASPEERLVAKSRSSGNDPELMREVYNYLRYKGESEQLATWYMRRMIDGAAIQPPCKSDVPKVTVVIPCHNYGEYLRECVESVLWQTFTDWEIIIVNDGSTDDTHEIAQKIIHENLRHRIQYYRQECKGIVQPRNFGVSIAHGKYILALDADDLLAPNFLEKTVPMLDEKPGVAYVSTKALFFGISNKIWPRSQFSPMNLPVTNQQTNTTLFRKAMWDDLGGWDERMTEGYVDWEFWIRATKKGWLGEQIDDCLFFYRRKGDSTVMAAKNKDPRLKLKIMALNPDIYQVDRIDENDPRLQKKNYIDPSFLRKDFRLPERKIAKEKSSMILRIEPQQKHTKKPRILFVSHDFPPYRMAGAQLYAMNLAKKLNEIGDVEVDMLYPVWRNEGKLDYTIRERMHEGLRVFELLKPIVQEPLKIYDERVVPAVQNLLKNNGYHAMHVHGLGQITLAPVFVAKELGIPIYATLHDYWLLCDHWHMIREDQRQCMGPESAAKCARCYIEDYLTDVTPGIEKDVIQYQQFRREMMKKLFASYDRVFAPSRYLAERFAEFGFSGIEVAPLGFEYGEIETGRPNDGLFHFGYTGQLIPRKGVNFLIDAFMKLPHKHARLDIYGPLEKDYAKELQAVASNDTRVRFHGRYNPEHLDAIMRTFDMAMVPSLMENYPLVVQEAFLRKTPVIATSVGGIPEVVVDDRNGYMVAAESSDSILAAMRRAIEDPACVERFTSNIEPVRRLSEDAAHYTSVYGGKKIDKPALHDKLRIQFYIAKNVHLPMFLELYEYVSRQQNVEEIIFCVPDFMMMTSSDGNREVMEKLLSLPVTFCIDPRANRVDITFIADAIAGKVKGAGKIVNIGHGTISKGYYFTDGVWTDRQNWVDLLCVPGEYARNELQNALSTRLVATGMPKLDPVFSGRIDIHALRGQLGIVPGRKIVLYAPTFNIDLSSLYPFAERFQELASGNWEIVIKLHGSTPGQYVNHYRQLAQRFPNIHFNTDDNLAPLLALADIMISDVSSAWMEFMALDKPVILYNHPNRFHYHGFDEKNIEWAWRDLGTQVDSFDELKRVLPVILDRGDDKSSIRMQHASMLFADRKGNACDNVWRAALDTLQSNEDRQPPTISLIIRASEDRLPFLCDQVFEVLFQSVMPYELLVIMEQRSVEVSGWIESLKIGGKFLRIVELTDEDRISHHARGEILMWLDSDVAIFKNFDYMLYQTFKNNPDVSALTVCTNDPARGGTIPSEIDQKDRDFLSRFAYEFVYRYQGRGISHCRCENPALVAVWKSRLPNDIDQPMNYVLELARSGRLSVANSVFVQTFSRQEDRLVRQFWSQREQLPDSDRHGIAQQLLSIARLSGVALDALETAVRLGIKQDIGKLISIILRIRSNDPAVYDRLEQIFSANPVMIDYLSGHRKILNRLLNTVDEVPSTKRSAMFYFFKNVHVPILMQIYDTFVKIAPDWEVAFSFMPWAPQIRAGFTPEQIESLHLPDVTITRTPQDFSPDVTFIADSAYPWVQNCGKLVHVGHGVLSKGQYYTDTEIARRDDAAAIVCVPGSIHKKNLDGVLRARVEVTGMAKLDPLFSGKIDREQAASTLGIPPNGRYILFAPTFNDELSAIPFVLDRIDRVIPEGYTLLIKLHGSTNQKYVKLYRDLSQRNPQVRLIDDLTCGMVMADVMISDVSSAMMEFAALEKPVVLFDNPNWRYYKNFNPNDIDFRWRDIGIRAKSVSELRPAVLRSLDNPREFAEKRRYYTDQIFTNKYDGKASERIVMAALSLFDEKSVETLPTVEKEERGVVFTFIGDFTEESGVDVLLEAFSKLPEDGWTLKLFGDPDAFRAETDADSEYENAPVSSPWPMRCTEAPW